MERLALPVPVSLAMPEGGTGPDPARVGHRPATVRGRVRAGAARSARDRRRDCRNEGPRTNGRREAMKAIREKRFRNDVAETPLFRAQLPPRSSTLTLPDP